MRRATGFVMRDVRLTLQVVFQEEKALSSRTIRPVAPTPLTPARARLEVLAAALLFSTGGAAIKATTLTAWQVASFRSGIAVLALVLLLPGARRPWRHGWGMVGVGAAYGATLVLFVIGNKLTTAANTIFLQSTAPLYVLALAPWWLGERARRRDLVYMAALAVGMSLFFVGQRQPDALAPDPLTGNLLAALAGVTWGLTLLGLRSLGRRDDVDAGGAGAAAVMVGNLFAFAVCLPWAVPGLASVEGITTVRAIGSLDWAMVAFLGVFQIAIAYVFLTRGLRRVAALEASLLLLVEPVLNPVWAWLFHGEEPGSWAVAGGAVILAATLAKSVVDARRSGRA